MLFEVTVFVAAAAAAAAAATTAAAAAFCLDRFLKVFGHRPSPN